MSAQSSQTDGWISRKCLQFLFVAAGGIAVGLATGWLATRVQKRLEAALARVEELGSSNEARPEKLGVTDEQKQWIRMTNWCFLFTGSAS